ncbi:unnamed protein product, partial [marine sediment metagenome]
LLLKVNLFIEKAYNLHPDLGNITLILAENGIEE